MTRFLTHYRDLIVIFILTLLTRLPFIFAGAGTDSDTWRVLRTAANFQTEGYIPSRIPGNPLHEFLLIAMWNMGIESVAVANLLSAIVSAIGVVFFTIIVREVSSSQRFIWVLVATFALTPVFFISSTSTIDYVYGTTFILGATVFVLKDRPLIAGILLGCAIGSRITSGAMLFPLLYLQWNRHRSGWLPFAGATLLIGGLWYIPGFLTLENDLIQISPFWSPLMLVRSVLVFGWFGSTGIIAALVTVLAFRKPIRLERDFLIVCVTTIILYSIAYYRLPHEAGYLLPLVPFVLLLLFNWVDEPFMLLVCALIIFSGVRMQWSDWQFRRAQIALVERIAAYDYDEPYMLVAREMLPILIITTDLQVTYSLSEPSNNRTIYYLQEAQLQEQLYGDGNLSEFGICVDCD